MLPFKLSIGTDLPTISIARRSRDVKYANINKFALQTVCQIDFAQFAVYAGHMNSTELDAFYREFGKLLRRHRSSVPDMTQEKLGHMVGLSRTSITNIEKGRQHIALHQLFAISGALKLRPEVLLPQAVNSLAASSWVVEKLPPGTEIDITNWADKLVGA